MANDKNFKVKNGLDVGGIVTATGGNSTNWNTAFGWGNHATTGYLLATTAASTYIPFTGGTLTGNLNFNNTSRATFGLSSTLQIYSDSANSFIEESGAGALFIKAANLYFRNPNDESCIDIVSNGGVSLYYDNFKKLQTTATGISVTGTISATGYNDTNWNTAFGWGNHATFGYLSDAVAASTYLALAGGTLTGTLNGTAADFSGNVDANQFRINGTTVIDSNGNLTNIGTISATGGTLTGGLTGTTAAFDSIYLNSNDRIYGGTSYRAMEASPTGTQLQLGEGYGLINMFKTQNAVSELKLWNNRQDAGNIGVSKVSGYNGVEVANMTFYRGSGGASGFVRFQVKPTNADVLADQFQIGDGSTAGYGVNVPIGGYRIGGTTVIDASRNLTNIGTIGASNIYTTTLNTGTPWTSANDGSGSGLDADLLDGQQGSYYAPNSSLGNYLPLTGGTVTGSTSLRAGGTHLGNHEFASASGTSTGYGDAGIEIREGAYGNSALYSAPRLSFHWGNVVASNISMDTGGAILIRNNPGTAYENFRANNIYANGTNLVWNTGNDGSGSGLDADLLDGLQPSQLSVSSAIASDYLNSVNYATDYSSNLIYWQASGLDTNYAPDTSWYNTIRGSHGGGNSYYSNTLAIQMTGGVAGTIFTQTRQGGSLAGWNRFWHSNNDGSGSGLDADLLDGQQGSYYYPKSGGAIAGAVQITFSGNNYFEVNSTSTGEAMTRYNNTTSNLWYTGIRSSTQLVGNTGYHIYSAAHGQTSFGITADGYVQGARAGTFWGSSNDGSGSGLDADLLDGRSTAIGADAYTIALRDGSGHLYGNYILGSYFNASSGNSENPTIGQIWTQNTSDNYLRKSTPAHFANQMSGYFLRSDAANTLTLTMDAAGNNYETGASIISIGVLSSSTSYNYHMVFKDANGTIKGRITNNTYGTQYTTSSDYRLKEDIQPVEDATSRILDLNVRNFLWSGTDCRTDGFLAHELAEVVPEAVVGEKDAVLEDGTPNYQTVDQTKLIPLLVKTIQELEARITALENA